MNAKKFLTEGRAVIGGCEYNFDNMEWSPHPAFKGVFLKHIIKAADTEKRLSCHIVKIEPHCELGSHIHEGRMELHEVIGGNGTCTIGEETFDYFSGTVSYIPDDIKHSVRAGSEGLYILAKFSPALI